MFYLRDLNLRRQITTKKANKLRKLSGWPIQAHNYRLKINAVKYENLHDVVPVCAPFVPNCAYPTGGTS